jgi:phosphoglycolate phosphatase-like HAD superfamily hydrolase
LANRRNGDPPALRAWPHRPACCTHHRRRPDAPVSLAGDSPADVKAAHGSKSRAIAVATGLTSAADLAATGPDFLLCNLREMRLSVLEGK